MKKGEKGMSNEGSDNASDEAEEKGTGKEKEVICTVR
jgi:hypothetical protein